jgi:hypothetical protein
MKPLAWTRRTTVMPLEDDSPRITLGELGRRLDRFESDMGSRFDDLIHRIESSISAKVYEADQRTAEARYQALEQRLEAYEKQEEDRRKESLTNRRLAISALLAPLLVTLVSTLLYVTIVGRG